MRAAAGNERILKTILHPGGKRRVLILQRSTGFYGFEEEYWSEVPGELCWCRYSQTPLHICDSAETAERDAAGCVAWLRTET